MENVTKYATFFLIFSIVFTYYSYALAFSAVDESRWDITLDYDDILTAGILLGENEGMNLTYGSGQQYFTTLNNTEIRVRWGYNVVNGYHFQFGSRVRFFGVEITWSIMEIKEYGNQIYNSTVVSNFNNETKWSRFNFKNGWIVFFTDTNSTRNNITAAIYNEGIVTVSIAESISFSDSDINMATFINWYTGTITGTSNYGLPSVFNIVLQVISVLSLLSVIIVVKEMFRL